VTRAGLALRLALRDLRSDAWRVALSAVLIALAVALGMLAFASAVPSSGAPDLRVDVQAAKGSSGSGEGRPVVRNGVDDRVVVTGGGRRVAISLRSHGLGWSEHQHPQGSAVPGAVVPVGSRVETFRTLAVRLVGQQRTTDVTIGDADPSGSFHAAGSVSAGRRPRAAGEILLTSDLARRLRVGIGGRVTAIEGRAPRSFTVVGLGSVSRRLSSGGGPVVEALTRPGGLAGAAGVGRTWLIRLARSPFGAGGGGGSAGPGVAISYQGAGYYGALELAFLAIVQVVALALPLFLTVAVLAIGLERRAWRARLLILAGADARLIAWIAALRGVVIGAVAAAGGALLTLAIARAVTGSTLSRTAVAVPAALAVAGAVIASLAAARMAAKLSGAGARASRPPTGREAVRSLARAGIAVAGLGALLALLASDLPWTGFIALAFVFALLAAVPSLAGALIVLSGMLPLPGRLRMATRSLARARWVTVPAVASFAMAALLVILVLAGVAVSPSSPGTSGGALGDARSAALAPDLRSTPTGTLVAPRAAAVAAAEELHPSWLAPVYPLRSGDGAGLSAVGPESNLPFADSLTYVVSPGVLAHLAGAVGLPSDTVVVLGGGAGGARTVSIASRRLPIVRARPSWPLALPHVFITRSSAAVFGAAPARVPTWIVTAAKPISGDRARTFHQAASAQGLTAVVAADAAGPKDGFSSGTGAGVALVVAVLGLVFGGVATMLVLAERREESRAFQLAGARPRDQRIAAATTALFFSGAGAALVALVYAGVAAVTWADGNSDLAGVLAFALLPLLALPPVLAVAAGLLIRPSRSVGRIGRVPRVAAGGD